MTWSTVLPNLPSEVLSAAQALTSAASVAREGLQAARVVMQAQTALVNESVGGALSTAQSLLDGAVGALEDAVQSLLGDAGLYVLMVPLPKKGLAYYLPQSLTLPAQAPTGALNARVGREVSQLPSWRRAFDSSELFTGGNAHFLKTVANSITDPGDGCRPQFSRTAYWGYVAVVAGASDISAAMSIAAYVDRLFRREGGSEQLAAGSSDMSLIATGLRARASTQGELVIVEWNPLASRPIGDDWVCAPWKYALIRSESPEAMTARRVLDLFSTVELSEGMAGRFGSKVLKLSTYNGMVNRYVDESEVITNQTYYYHLAVRSRAESPQGERKEWPFDLLSSAVRYRRTSRTAPPGRRGTPPDWYRTPSVLSLIPPLGRLSDQLLEAVGSMRSSSTQALSYGRAALDALDRTIARLGRILSDLEQVLGQLNAIYATPSANVHVLIQQGQGDAMSVVKDLATQMDTLDDPNRPAFDTGDEYVCGMLAIATAPSEAALVPLMTMLQGLFNGSALDPVLAGIESVQGALGVVRTTLTETTPSRTFNEDLTPRPAGQGDFTCE